PATAEFLPPLEVAERVGGGAVDPHLEVEVRAGAVAGVAGVADQVALADLGADGGGEARLEGVAGGEPAAVVDAGVVAVTAAFVLGLLEDHGPVGGGADRRPF